MQKKLLGHTADVPAIPEFSFSTVMIAPITINIDCYKPDITSIVKLFITEFFSGFWEFCLPDRLETAKNNGFVLLNFVYSETRTVFDPLFLQP